MLSQKEIKEIRSMVLGDKKMKSEEEVRAKLGELKSVQAKIEILNWMLE